MSISILDVKAHIVVFFLSLAVILINLFVRTLSLNNQWILDISCSRPTCNVFARILRITSCYKKCLQPKIGINHFCLALIIIHWLSFIFKQTDNSSPLFFWVNKNFSHCFVIAACAILCIKANPLARYNVMRKYCAVF